MWRKLKEKLPAGEKKHKEHAFERLLGGYAQLKKEGMKVTAKLGKPFVPPFDGKIHLDSLLSFAVCTSHPCPPIQKPGTDVSVIPIPLELLWVSESGLPLWASTDMEHGDHWKGYRYWHKRFPLSAMLDYAEKPSAPTTRGGFKEMRVPQKAVMPKDGLLIGYAIGNVEEVRRLLGFVNHVGKKPAYGYGAVLEWTVEPIEVSESFILDSRPVPSAYYGKNEGRVSAWTPPYWYRPWHSAIQID